MGARIYTRDTPPLESIARVQRADQPGLEDDDHKSQARGRLHHSPVLEEPENESWIFFC